MTALVRVSALVASTWLTAACHPKTQPGDPGPPPPGPSATLTFSVTPVEEGNIEFVVPIGNLNPPGHTFASDHMYFYHRLNHPAAPAFPVVAPAAGTVADVRHDADDSIRIRATSSLTYYLAHIVLDSGVTSGKTVTAGERLGVTSLLAFAMDLGLVNSDSTLFFVTPARYSSDTLHAESPLKYFSEPLRSRLYAKEQGSGGDGKIDFDQSGKLVGNWFHETLSVPESPNVESGPRHLAFVRDVNQPAAVRISIGGTLTVPGVWGIPADAPDPAGVTPGSGLVTYRLLFIEGNTQAGVMLVQMIDAARIKVETFAGSSASPTGFTGAAQTYVR